jgi:uncharacterized protein YjiS (DUF1127 family)
MYTRSFKEELAFAAAPAMTHYFQDEPEEQVTTTPARPGLIARFRAALRWIVEMPRRRAVMEELSMLSDHELADIGLARGDLPYIFDSAFCAERNAARGGEDAFRQITRTTLAA